MDYIRTWNESIYTSFLNLWDRLINFLPQLIGAIIVFIIGMIIASLLSKVVYKLITLTRIDTLLSRIQLIQKLKTSGISISISYLVAQIVKWFFIIVTLMTVSDILGLKQINSFLESILLYLPNVVVAIIILAIGFVIGQFVAEVIRKSAIAGKLNSSIANILAMISDWSIVVFALMASLFQLGVASSLIQILFTGVVATLALALGLAFGLGGRERAARFLEELERREKKTHTPSQP